MRKLFYLAFCVVLAMGVGCAITAYDTITDNDQGNGGSSGTINTSGKAHIIEGIQIATIWSDGNDELFTMVNQSSNGDRSLTTYNNFSTSAGPTFHDDLYCNPDWNGCSVFTAPDPAGGLFDGTPNFNCSGARSLQVLLSTGRYYGECGRMRLPLADRLNLLNLGRIGVKYGKEGLFYDLTRNSFSLWLDNNSGIRTMVPITGSAQLFASPDDSTGAVDLTNSLLAPMGRYIANWVEQNSTEVTTAETCYMGVCWSYQIDTLGSDRILANVNTHF